MRMRHLVPLVEEPSMEEFLRLLLPRVLPECCRFEIHSFRSKPRLLRNLKPRLRSYARWLPDDWRIIVLVDRDNDDCRQLKKKLEEATAAAGLRTRSEAGGPHRQTINRIVIEELEAWYFGDWQAVRSAYPRVPDSISRSARYRDPDAISKTWETFERILKKVGYFTTGLRKIEAARDIAIHIEPGRNHSNSSTRFAQRSLQNFLMVVSKTPNDEEMSAFTMKSTPKAPLFLRRGKLKGGKAVNNGTREGCQESRSRRITAERNL